MNRMETSSESKSWLPFAAGGLEVFVLMWVFGLLPFFFGILIPYLAIAIFIIGFISKVVKWARSPGRARCSFGFTRPASPERSSTP